MIKEIVTNPDGTLSGVEAPTPPWPASANAPLEAASPSGAFSVAGSAWMEMPSGPGWWWRMVSGREPIAELICEIRGKLYFASPYYNSIRTSFDEWIRPNPIVKFLGPILPPNAEVSRRAENGEQKL